MISNLTNSAKKHSYKDFGYELTYTRSNARDLASTATRKVVRPSAEELKNCYGQNL